MLQRDPDPPDAAPATDAGSPGPVAGPAPPDAGVTDAGDTSAAAGGRPGPVTTTAPGPTGSAGSAPANNAGGAPAPTTAQGAGSAGPQGAPAPMPGAPTQNGTPTQGAPAQGRATTQGGAAAPATAQGGAAPAAPVPVATTDVPYPPARPSIDVPQRPVVLVAGAVPPAAETMPAHGIDTAAEFWGIPEVGTYVTQLVEGWRTRRAAQGQTIDVAATRASFVTDFDETIQGWFNRSSFSVPWAGIEQAALQRLSRERARLTAAAGRRQITESGKRRRLTAAEVNAEVEAGLVVYRQGIVDRIKSHLTQGAWGWMVERREHLDFVTVTQRGVRALRGFDPAALPVVDEVATVRAALARGHRELTPREREAAIGQATAARRRATRDPAAALTPTEEEAAVVAAEARKLGGRTQVTAAVRAAAIAVEERDWIDVHEQIAGRPAWGPVWDRGSIGVLPTTATFVLMLINSYGTRFTASNYGGHGGGSFAGRGRSLDLTIPERQANGFFDANAAIRFALAIDGAATAVGAQWRVLYNDFTVARAVNERLGTSRMVEIANTERKNGAISNVNWHGPIVTHFHLDLAF